MDYIINQVLSSGNACCKAYKINLDKSNCTILEVKEEKEKFFSSLNKSLEALLTLSKNNPSQKEYINIQKMMLEDKYLENKVLSKIESGLSAYDAIEVVFDEYLISIKESDSLYLKERENDFNDIRNRLLTNLVEKNFYFFDEDVIVVSSFIYPSFLIRNQRHIKGIIVTKGGYTSHCAIMCRSLEIPYIISEDALKIKHDSYVLISTYKNILKDGFSYLEYIELNKRIKEIKDSNNKAVKHDGFLFLANISSNDQINKVIEADFDGVGLYRTEMIFMMSKRPYTKNEQKDIYLNAIEKLKDKFIVFRTFDIGDDKNIEYLKAYKKGIDNYINNPVIFETQIRAMLEANIYGNIKIMFPMIYTNEEFNYLRNWVLRINQEINGNKVLIGMMLETKEALEHITTFKNLDFISIGTNDLTYELYNISRDDSRDKVNNFFSDLVKRLIIAFDYCNKNNIMFSICGELACNKEMALEFYKIGVRSLSVTPSGMRILNLAYNEFNKN